MERKAYPSNVGDEEWGFVAPYLVLMREDVSQREVLNGMRWIVRAGASWHMMPNDPSPWRIVYEQTRAGFSHVCLGRLYMACERFCGL